MSLDKAILHKKEHRKQYHDSRVIDMTCRSHGTCFWCQGNRFHKLNKQLLSAKEQIEELKKEEEK